MKKYNLTLLKEQCGNDKSFFNEMLDIFIRSTMEGIDQMEDAVKTSDYSKLSHYAHKIISPCRHIEANDLIPTLREIELKAGEKTLDFERAKELVSTVKNEALQLAQELKSEYM